MERVKSLNYFEIVGGMSNQYPNKDCSPLRQGDVMLEWELRSSTLELDLNHE
jgi:hypothetical protein